MKKRICLCVVLFFTISLISCQKEAVIQDVSMNSLSQKENAKDWMRQFLLRGDSVDKIGISSVNNKISGRVPRLSQKLRWSDAIDVKGGTNFVLVPIEKERVALQNNRFIERMFLFWQNDKKEFNLNIVEFVGSRDALETLEGVAVDITKNILYNEYKAIKSIDLDIFVYDRNYKYLISYKVNKTDWVLSKEELVNSKASLLALENQTSWVKSEGGNNNGCELWGTYWIQYDANGNVVAETLVDTYWVCDVGDGVDTGESSDNPGGGSGVGGSSNEEEDDICNYTFNDAAAILRDITSNKESGGNVTFGGEITLPNGTVEKELLIARNFFTINFTGLYSMKYLLVFKGVIYKNGMGGNWKYKSLTFDKILEHSGAVPPCFSINNNISVSTNVASDKLTANFTAIISSTISVQCLFGMSAGTIVNNLSQTYNTNGGIH